MKRIYLQLSPADALRVEALMSCGIPEDGPARERFNRLVELEMGRILGADAWADLRHRLSELDDGEGLEIVVE